MTQLAPNVQNAAMSKRTIMSGVVRRQQPLNKTMAAGMATEISGEGEALNATADPGMTTSQNQSGVMSANRISFYPTSPARQSYMQTQGNKAYYNKQSNNFSPTQRNTTTSQGRQPPTTANSSNLGNQRSDGNGTTLQNKWVRLMQG